MIIVRNRLGRTHTNTPHSQDHREAERLMTQPLTPRQRELFNALLQDFLAEGFESFTIDGATKRYQCSKSTMYALGPSRDAIIRRVLVSFFKEITRRTAVTTAPTYAQALEKYFSSMTIALEPASPEFMRDLASEPAAQEVYSFNTKRATETIHKLLSQGVEAGEFTAEYTDFVSRLIQRSMSDIQQGFYSDTLAPAEAYHTLGQLILHGISLR